RERVGVVRFMEEQDILLGVCAEFVAEEFVGAVIFVQRQIIEGLTVLRPLDAGVIIDAAVSALDPFGIQFAADKVLDEDGVYLRAFVVDGVGEFGLVGADTERADAAKLMPFGKDILIEQ